jgi:hypothetical protein
VVLPFYLTSRLLDGWLLLLLLVLLLVLLVLLVLLLLLLVLVLLLLLLLLAAAGLNFYVETHIDRLSEDPEAFCKIFDRAPYFEVNADISHYNYRGITKGPHLARINERVNHCHQRMARQHGDLSSDLNVHFSTVGAIGDAEADWAAKGVTWQAMESMKPGFQGGMSSRVVVGESGPAFSVKDACALDAKLIPLYRHMAEYADAQIGQSGGTSNPFR